jgi:HEAT repeat protein
MNTRFEELVARLDGVDFHAHVVALAGAGAGAIPAVQASMSHSNWRIRRGCAAVLAYVDDAESLRRLALLTRDPKKKVRKMAVLSLGLGRMLRKDDRDPIDPVPHLAHSALHDPSVRVRRVAVLALLLQPPARRVARLLRKVLAAEEDAKALRVAEWGLRQQEKRA